MPYLIFVDLNVQKLFRPYNVRPKYLYRIMYLFAIAFYFSKAYLQSGIFFKSNVKMNSGLRLNLWHIDHHFLIRQNSECDFTVL
jgi:hypothetical protein